MDARIVYPSALEYWLKDEGVPYRFRLPEREEALLGRKGLTTIVNALNFSLPVHIAVPQSICRMSTNNIQYHRLSEKIPEHCFIPIADHVLVSSPAMCFLQAANELSFHELVKLACDLCAIYVLDKHEEFGQRRRDQIVTVKEISDFLSKIKNIRGINKAQAAIRYASDCSNSPVESQLATLAGMPFHYGAYGLLLPEMNREVSLSPAGKDYLGRDTCCCDMVWEKQKVVLEYDSDLAHSTLRQIKKDKNRVAALSVSGYRVISVTSEKIADFRAVESLFMGIREALGMRSYPDRMEKYFEKRWEVVHDLMFKDRPKQPPITRLFQLA